MVQYQGNRLQKGQKQTYVDFMIKMAFPVGGEVDRLFNNVVNTIEFLLGKI